MNPKKERDSVTIKEVNIDLPDINEPLTNLDSLYWRVSKLVPGERLAFDLKNIKFLRPLGIISLLLAAKQAHEKTQQRVRLHNLKQEVLYYLERVNFFQYDFVYTLETLQFWDRWSRSRNSLSVIEIAKLTSPHDVFALRERIEQILETWFDGKPLQTYRDSAVKAIMEICNNSIEHSELGLADNQYGECFCLLQKYTHGNSPEIAVAIGDLGVGNPTH